jgi:hypothetical protein
MPNLPLDYAAPAPRKRWPKWLWVVLILLALIVANQAMWWWSNYTFDPNARY